MLVVSTPKNMLASWDDHSICTTSHTVCNLTKASNEGWGQPW
jgi:hypothetical protein